MGKQRRRKKKFPVPDLGPGYLRARERLGAAGMEELRLKVLAEQAAEQERAAVTPRDRTTYTVYPPPVKHASIQQEPKGIKRGLWMWEEPFYWNEWLRLQKDLVRWKKRSR